MTSAGMSVVWRLTLVGVVFVTSSSCSRRSMYDVIKKLDELNRNDLQNTGGCSDVDLEATAWMDALDPQLRQRLSGLSYDNWKYITNLTDFNAANLEKTQSAVNDWLLEKILVAKEYLRDEEKICNKTTRRLLKFLVNYNTIPIANNLQTRARLNHIVNEMVEIYSTAEVTKAGKTYRLDPELTEIMATSRDYDVLLWAWQSWRAATGPRIKPLYVELVDKMNEAARDNGFSDVGAAWRVTDFEVDNIEPMLDKLYQQIKPFYIHLHAYVRRRLLTTYQNRNMDPNGPIQAHLLGDMWAQEWNNIADLVLPYPKVSSPDVTRSLQDNGYTPLRMFQLAEDFFTSIGLEPMTTDFWAKSVTVRPADNRPLQCHASAEEFYTQRDFRIKMCTRVDVNDLQTVHHEMGHVEYFMQYRHQPTLFRTGANAAFHEAVGDTIALSVMSAKHLQTIGLSAKSSRNREAYEQNINSLMRMALQKLAFLPFAYIIDKWRFAVFRGEITPDEYNSKWWQLRETYQGVAAPVSRSETDFDAGSKYHVPANVPYSRYFLSFIGQFQFHAALCKTKGDDGDLNQCDIFESMEAGQKLKSVLKLGASVPWPTAMRILTGQSDFDANAILEYFAPLIDWLHQENKGHDIGWSS